MREVAKGPETVIHHHQHHALVGDAVRVVVRLAVAREDGERATVEPHHDGKVRSLVWYSDIQVKAVFTHPTLAARLERWVLRGLVAPGDRVARPVPAGRLERRLPA